MLNRLKMCKTSIEQLKNRDTKKEMKEVRKNTLTNLAPDTPSKISSAGE